MLQPAVMTRERGCCVYDDVEGGTCSLMLRVMRGQVVPSNGWEIAERIIIGHDECVTLMSLLLLIL
jgi:hypothetical protein